MVKLKRHYRSQTVPGIILEIEPEFNTSKIFLGNTLIVYFANLSKKVIHDIVFGHFEIQNFKQNSFKICSDGLQASRLLDKTNLVISGHLFFVHYNSPVLGIHFITRRNLSTHLHVFEIQDNFMRTFELVTD